jgi:Tol biopolymer transport system component
MGQVYRARDTRLNRDVALKILPDIFATDPDRLARFTREAQTLASLNHANIAHIHGLEESGGVRALVMELVEGEDLSQRIERGAIPIEEAIPIAKGIAEAVEAAHEQGIIHRDLKPANIKLRADGTVKVLDFGLAKAMDAGGGTDDRQPWTTDPKNSPTMTRAMTQVGMILGTAAYMSPEQARGKSVDKRADIWAFGCVFYEMLTGTSLFAGDSVPETLGLIFSREPDLTTLPAATPSRVRTLIARCLVRDPRQRLRDIGEARVVLGDPHERGGDVQSVPLPAFWWPVTVVLVAGALLAGWALARRTDRGTANPVVTHLDIGYPRDVENFPGTSLPPAISADGRTVAMIGVKDGVRRVFVRHLDRAAATELPDTAGANGAVFSPDSGSVAVLFTSGLITRIALADQQRKVVASGADVTLSITWTEAGIIFGREGGLWIVSPDGGAPRSLTALDRARREVAHQNALLLPGGRVVVFASQTTDPGGARIESVPVAGGSRSVLIEQARSPVWSPTGHLLFARDGAVLAVAIDQNTGTPLGTATPIMAPGAIELVASGQLGLTLSSTGTLLATPAGFTDTRVVSTDRSGAALALDLPTGRYSNPRISPDGRRLLVENGQDIEAHDLVRGSRTRLTAATLSTVFSTWTADSARVVFRRFASTFWVASDGSGATGPVPGGIVSDFPSSPGPDPDSFIGLRIRPETSGDVFLMSISGAFEPRPLVATTAYEGGAQLSPDGRWLLYQSDASGRPEIYVRRYPALDRQWQVSDGGGVQARWSRDNREIYYRSGGHVVAATFDQSGAEPVFGKPVALFADDYDFGAGASIANYDVTRDGRFIMIRRGVNGGKLSVVVNWTEELKQILASGGVR